MRKGTIASIIMSAAFLVATVAVCCAQGMRYMDSSGTIHFVDSINQVPRQYRAQIYPPTPTPVLDKRAQAQVRRAQKDEDDRRIRAERDKKREEEQRKMEYERQRQKEERELRRREEATSLIRGSR
jgi:hypothetical protein